ncbi:TrmA family RNA methyltransferase [Candidatus Kinetoplastibacterium oncopeltii TCC290E]|uniref:TrmA family RNA methyltransferase n=1 Tax=Candidatus Kinetoplastidibacterium stringomonadis TCC290E TaxID=1208920 RepID=M1LW34_9PROT|nr:23S rRNA (uracil(1939)-C(5))-methyltransferase RlmD [Candidatus Kinetoplastibacterium oncopeltii]AGF48271.1 TrmA family RNA methyltransferase [Candidatus Kinetoplastibacterium oncopeltii TCC290E]
MLLIESIDAKGTGISHDDNGKVVFIDGALPGELVQFRTIKVKSSYSIAVLTNIIVSSPYRVVPHCKYFNICGGCSIQHLDAKAQVAIKQRVLEDSFCHIGKVKPNFLFSPIYGETWNYRNRARLFVRFSQNTEKLLLGFYEKKSNRIIDILYCPVLSEKINIILTAIREMILSLSIRNCISQVEIANGDSSLSLLIYNSCSLSKCDIIKIVDFSVINSVDVWLHSYKDSIYRVDCIAGKDTCYSLPEFGISIPFGPKNFTQINHNVNSILVSKVISLMEIGPNDTVLDMFCGLGNFTLPIAKIANKVTGVDIDDNLIYRANKIASYYKLHGIVNFIKMNLFLCNDNFFNGLDHFDIILIDPPRSGANLLIKSIANLDSNKKPRRIVYVSCNPHTLARDSSVLVIDGGYRIICSGIINMFPHTSHVESITVFDK